MNGDGDKRSAKELAEELELLHSVVSIFEFDAAGVVREVNGTGASLVGVDRERLVGRPFSEHVVASDEQAFSDHLAAVSRAGERRSVELRLRNGSDATHVRLDSVPSGAGVFSVLIDVSDRRQLQEQLDQAQKMEAMGRLAGGVSHDFNNVLMAILGYTELLLLRLPPKDASRAAVEMIQKTAERARSLTQQLVAFSRKQVIEHHPVNLNLVVRETGRMLGRVLGEDVELSITSAADLWQVRADQGQMQQVLMNLALNARDAMPTGGRLVIETANVELDEDYTRRHVNVRPGPYVALRVSDTGVGIEPDVLAHIFEPFFTTKPVGKGTGLGLSTVFGIVDQCGGHINVESTPGAGTAFTICLPRFEGAARPARAKKAKGDAAPSAPLPQGSETVLIVEDEPTVRETISDMLRMAGYTVLEAGHAAEALHVSERHEGPIQLMLTDVVMPGMGGRELAQKLLLARPTMQVLFMSGHTDDAMLRHGVRDALYSFIQKPFTMDVLVRRVRTMLDDREGRS